MGERIGEWVVFYGLKILGAVIIIVLGWWGAKLAKNVVQTMLRKKNTDETVITFVSNVCYIAILTFVFIAALAKLGVQTASFIAVIGAAGLAIGLSLQGALANFAAGFLIILFRPFKVGHFVEVAGVSGTIEEIQIFTTHLKTPDNKAVIIPNAKITGDNIINYSAKDIRRVDLVAGVSYTDDLQKVRSVLQDILGSDERILKNPEPMIAVSELADSSVNFVVRGWVKTEHYWDVYFDATEKIKTRFDAEGISIPFPQQDVHLFEKK